VREVDVLDLADAVRFAGGVLCTRIATRVDRLLHALLDDNLDGAVDEDRLALRRLVREELRGEPSGVVRAP